MPRRPTHAVVHGGRTTVRDHTTTSASQPSGPSAVLLEEQIRYYRDGAQQYDTANHTLLAADDSDGSSRRAGRERALAALAPARGQNVLELAGGTGLYTKSLAALADRLTVVDASPESLAINLSGLEPGSDVTFVEADIFEWTPPERYDVVVFAFWLSHVPLDLFDQFWLLVESCLESDGTVVVIDARADRADASTPQKATFFSEKQLDDGVVMRQLPDGSRHRIVRIMWEPQQLRSRLASTGWDATFVDSHWLIGHVVRSQSDRG
jgi:demethylmenaquinone methyltransferase/2-methoxy-6-polyprenyl-1,4-benzoquinol methylase